MSWSGAIILWCSRSTVSIGSCFSERSTLESHGAWLNRTIIMSEDFPESMVDTAGKK